MDSDAILIHTHGVGSIDYSTMTADDLPEIERLATERRTTVVPGVFLARELTDHFADIVRFYGQQPAQYPHIAGFSVEGPLLGTSGGVPPRGIWSPNPDEWERIAQLGRYGLRYIVMAPDGGDLDDYYGDVTYRDIIDLFYENGVRLALGHFRHTDPELSAERTAEVIDYVQHRWGPDPTALLTDHLFNDMPRRFKHAWRSAAEQETRSEYLDAFLQQDWRAVDLAEHLGPVPAALIRAAEEGKVMPFLNCDGDHVDLAICEMTINYLGPERLIGITDDTEVDKLAGEKLERHDGTGLWYREDGIVAAGSGGLGRQLEHLSKMRVPTGTAEYMFARNPLNALRPLASAPSFR